MDNKYNRRSFIKVTAVSGGGMLLGFNWFVGQKQRELSGTPASSDADWTEFNGYIRITSDNVIRIMAPNPEFGQNVKTSLPMIVADELDADWNTVVVEQASFDTKLYVRQFAGGSQSVRTTWKPLRTAGASARQMLRQAAANAWNVPLDEVSTSAGKLLHNKSGKSATYGEFAADAAKLPVPAEVKFKAPAEFSIIRQSQKNVEGRNIVTGKPVFGLDYSEPGMLIAMIEHPPAFGLKLKSWDGARARRMPGIKDIFTIQVFPEGYERESFDTRTFNELVVVVGNTTWEVMNARKKLQVEWEPITEKKETVNAFGNKREETIPAGLESSARHLEIMQEMAAKPARQLRKDGDPEKAFSEAARILERTYTAPFLAHNTMEPMNCFARVTDTDALFVVPLQAPEFAERSLSKRLGIPVEKIDIRMTRMGGGFGRRAYGHYLIEAALISQKTKTAVKLVYSREDDMTYGIYRPAYTATYRAALDANNNLTAFHVKGGGFPEHPVAANRFPAGAVDNYLAEGWEMPSNITIGAFRAPRSNFIACAEQSFLDELAELMGKDTIELRLEMLQRAKERPVGANNDYDADRYAGVLKLVREKSGWGSPDKSNLNRGVAAYFCHNSYAAHVVDMRLRDGQPYVEQVFSAVDCGIVVNPDAASNMVEGAVVDGIGNALYGALTLRDGAPDQRNFNTYKMIRMYEAPKKVEAHFVQNDIDPTGLGEPPFPPVFGAIANALYKTTGRRFYRQPFSTEFETEQGGK
jgi:isoquinoline 1-oxidoreductase beta subunit